MSLFGQYLQHFIYAQKDCSMLNALNKDYPIIYDYLMDILEKDNVVGPLLVRNAQHRCSYMNSDILLDFTRQFQIRSQIHDPFLYLMLHYDGRDDICSKKNFTFFGRNLNFLSYRITESVWNAFNTGFSKMGVYVRGHSDEIYKLRLSPFSKRSNYVYLIAASEDVSLKIDLRILIKYTRRVQDEPYQTKPYPEHLLKQEMLAVVPLHQSIFFEVSLPLLEYEIKKQHFGIIMIQRLLMQLFRANTYLYHLKNLFVESVSYTEYLDSIHNNNANMRCSDILMSILLRILECFKNRKFPYFWNTKLNLINYFEKDYVIKQITLALKEVITNIEQMNSNKDLAYEDFIQYFDLQMEPQNYTVDKFGIYKNV